ncbi:MAG: hypothetical protein JJU28_03105 [Cyclobacteriaceae bacterium]|nr:hypothetical protein [Cyclobacteriaceae bacterium]
MESRKEENKNLSQPEIQWKRLAFFTLGFSAILLLYRYFAEPYFSPSALKIVYNSEWVTYFASDSSLQFTAPAELKTVYLPEKIDYMRYIQSFQYDSDGELQISVNISVFEIGEKVSIEGALQGALHELSQIQGLTLVKNKVEEIQRGGKVISVQQGEFFLMDERYTFVNLVSAEDLHLWQLTVTYPTKDLYGKKIAQKMQDNFNILL